MVIFLSQGSKLIYMWAVYDAFPRLSRHYSEEMGGVQGE